MVELLVLMAIIGIMVAMLLPAVQAARESTRRMQCGNNIRQLGLALLGYESQWKSFPPSVTFENPNLQLNREHWRNWVIMLLPYIEEQALFDSFKPDLPINHPTHRAARGTFLELLLCPSDPYNRIPFASSVASEGDNWARGNYGANAALDFHHPSFAGGPNSPRWNSNWHRGIMGANVALGISQIRDGASNTLLLAELRAGISTVDRRGVWALGGPGASSLWRHASDDFPRPNTHYGSADNIHDCRAIIDSVGGIDALAGMGMGCCRGCDNEQGGARSLHPGGVNACLADGSVRFISNDIQTSNLWNLDPNVLKANPALFGVWQRLNASSDGLPLSQNED